MVTLLMPSRWYRATPGAKPEPVYLQSRFPSLSSHSEGQTGECTAWANNIQGSTQKGHRLGNWNLSDSLGEREILYVEYKKMVQMNLFMKQK